MLSRFHLIPERNGQTDGRTDIRRTDIFAISISRVSILTRDKKQQPIYKPFHANVWRVIKRYFNIISRDSGRYGLYFQRENSLRYKRLSSN